METPSTSSNPNPSGDWSVVLRRRRGGNHRHTPPVPRLQTLTPTLAPPSPWTPSDPETDPERESRLLKRMQSSINRLESSRFYRGFLSRLRDPQIQDGLARVLASGPEIQIVVYGIGSIESYDPPRLQLALAVLLRRDLGRAVGSVEVFDPVLSAAECAVVEALGCAVLRRDERGRREATTPTLFYMPHCEAALYDNLLSANWRPSALNRMVVLGNSFGKYERYVGDMAGGSGSVALGAAVKHMLGARRFLREVEMEQKAAVGDSGEEVEDDHHDGFYRAFHDMSWHFFELDHDADMNFLG